MTPLPHLSRLAASTRKFGELLHKCQQTYVKIAWARRHRIQTKPPCIWSTANLAVTPQKLQHKNIYQRFYCMKQCQYCHSSCVVSIFHIRLCCCINEAAWPQWKKAFIYFCKIHMSGRASSESTNELYVSLSWLYALKDLCTICNNCFLENKIVKLKWN